MPAAPFSGIQRRLPAAAQVQAVPLVDVLFLFVSLIPGGQQRLGHVQRHVEKHDVVRPGQPEQTVFVILQPGEITVPFLRGKLGHLMDGVGSSVPGGNDEGARLVIGLPEPLIAGIPIHRVKGGGGVGVHRVGGTAQLPGQVHFHKRRGGLGIVGKRDLLIAYPGGGQILVQAGQLGGFPAAVQAVDDHQPSHHVRSFSC